MPEEENKEEDEEAKDDDNELMMTDSLTRVRSDRKEELVFQIHPHPVAIDVLKEACIAQNYPLIEEYDFKRDT